MKIFLVLIALTFFSFASLIPYKSHARVIAVNKNQIVLDQALPKNMSALVIRNLNKINYAIAYIQQKRANYATIIDKDPLGGGHLATIKPIVKVGDSVEAGFLYDKYMLLAPNKEAYNDIVNSFALRPINSTLFLAYLKAKRKKSPNSRDYKEFAKLLGVGLFLIAKNNTIEVYDPISKEVVKKVHFPFDNSINIKPFYTNLSK